MKNSMKRGYFFIFVFLLPSFFANAQSAPTSASSNESLSPLEIVNKVRDPFKRPKILDAEGLKSELDLVSVDELQLVGVMAGPKRIRALVQTPSGKTYFIHENMKVGFRKGIVSQVTRDFVKVRETVVNVLGQEEQIESMIRMEMDTQER